jgi:hypothetical protein
VRVALRERLERDARGRRLVAARAGAGQHHVHVEVLGERPRQLADVYAEAAHEPRRVLGGDEADARDGGGLAPVAAPEPPQDGVDDRGGVAALPGDLADGADERELLQDGLPLLRRPDQDRDEAHALRGRVFVQGGEHLPLRVRLLGEGGAEDDGHVARVPHPLDHLLGDGVAGQEFGRVVPEGDALPLQRLDQRLDDARLVLARVTDEDVF